MREPSLLVSRSAPEVSREEEPEVEKRKKKEDEGSEEKPKITRRRMTLSDLIQEINKFEAEVVEWEGGLPPEIDLSQYSHFFK